MFAVAKCHDKRESSCYVSPYGVALSPHSTTPTSSPTRPRCLRPRKNVVVSGESVSMSVSLNAAFSNVAVRPSVCLSPCPMLLAQKQCILQQFMHNYNRTLGNSMLKVKPTVQHGRATTGRDRNGDEVVAGEASEAFARWLHHRYIPVELLSAGGVSCRWAIPCAVWIILAVGVIVMRSYVHEEWWHDVCETD